MSAHWKRDSLTRTIEQSKADISQRTLEIAALCGEGQFGILSE